ncbi:hypothetical protein M413DRAFT_11741 [Hebeloma cylindrosporum]|uniref:Uncharacterized protein n=1 Tax=Hebeloma cylindrosporum TaxID=76867 RepID=A0A0C2XRJ8_HEBCY|nr:hypothetical protein M413DRAFT_11741 [Hebeloma cylindrosporum h7]
MSYSYERSSKTLNEAYYSDSDDDECDSYRNLSSLTHDSVAKYEDAKPSRTPYLGGPSFARADPSYARADPEQNLIANQRLPPMKEPRYLPSTHSRSNYRDRPCYFPNNYDQPRIEVPGDRRATLLGRSKDEIFADLQRVLNGGRNRTPRDDTPSMISDDSSPSPSTPSIASLPVSPCRDDPSPPSHIEPQEYPQGYEYGHKSHDSAENALVSFTQHMHIEPRKSVAQARVPSHYPIQFESSFAQAKTPSLHTAQIGHSPPTIVATRSTPQAEPSPYFYSFHAEPPRAIRMIEPSRNLALMPPPSQGTEPQARVIESPPKSMAPRPTPQPANQIEHPKMVANPPVRLRPLAPRIIMTDAITERRNTETRTTETPIVEPRITPTHFLRADVAKVSSNKVDTSMLNLLADSALGNNHDDEGVEGHNESSYLPPIKRQKAQNLEKPPRPPPQKKRGSRGMILTKDIWFLYLCHAIDMREI